jgi:hypothetical protein
MRIGRTVIISAILALSAAGSITASVVVSAPVAQAPAAHVLATTSHMSPNYLYHG